MYYNIPKQMLYDRVNGHVTHWSIPGPDPCLSNFGESEFAERGFL